MIKEKYIKALDQSQIYKYFAINELNRSTALNRNKKVREWYYKSISLILQREVNANNMIINTKGIAFEAIRYSYIFNWTLNELAKLDRKI